MRLYERMMEPCTRIAPSFVQDGEGGRKTVWTKGDGFEAALVRSSAAEVRIGERQGTASTWTVTSKEILGFHDVFQRDSDGMAFRVTSRSADVVTPRGASFAFCQCSAEEWEVPNGD